VETDAGQYNEPSEIFWASGACLFIRTADFRACGGFDDSFFAHMEEIDLCWRMKKKGYKICYVPGSHGIPSGRRNAGESKPAENIS
jgi:GT2 family glycosyltransferase